MLLLLDADKGTGMKTSPRERPEEESLIDWIDRLGRYKMIIALKGLLEGQQEKRRLLVKCAFLKAALLLRVALKDNARGLKLSSLTRKKR